MDKNKILVVFDLDDTLYKEVDFLKSGYQFICDTFQLDDAVYQGMIKGYYEKKNVFQELLDQYALPIQLTDLIEMYRLHIPKISLDEASKATLDILMEMENVTLALLTDGRSKTQRNKIMALGIEPYFKEIIISEEFGSEKPNPANYLYFSKKYTDFRYYYIADNIQKDFISPNELAWETICLKDNGKNIHTQEVNVPVRFLPNHTISVLNDFIAFIKG
ncbi:HAD family hydrolase [Aquirufa sp. ROCK-SH2]